MNQLYARLGRLLHTWATPLMRFYLTPKMTRVRVAITNENGELLMVRSWFSEQKWSLPGGGIKRHETVVQAGSRELAEETNVRLKPDDLKEIGSFENPIPKKPFQVACVFAQIPRHSLRISPFRRFEILEVTWVPLGQLPQDRSPSVDRCVEFLKAKNLV